MKREKSKFKCKQNEKGNLCGLIIAICQESEVKKYHIFINVARWLRGKESTCQCGRCRFNPWVRKIPLE